MPSSRSVAGTLVRHGAGSRDVVSQVSRNRTKIPSNPQLRDRVRTVVPFFCGHQLFQRALLSLLRL